MSQQTEAPAGGPAGRGGSYARKSALDLIRSLAVIGAVVAVVYLLVPRPAGTSAPPVDLEGAVEVAEAAGDVPVVVPELGDGWQVTSARRDRPVDGDPATWHVGYLSPSGGYAGLEVADDVTESWVERVTTDGEQGGTQDVGGTDWQVYESEEPRRTSLLLEQDGRTTVVTGSAVLDELVELADAATRVP